MGPQFYVMNNNILLGKAFQVFEMKSWENAHKTMKNYGIDIIQGLKTHFLPPMEIQRQNRYLYQVLLNPRTSIYKWLSYA